MKFQLEFSHRLQHHANTTAGWKAKAFAAKRLRAQVALNLLQFGNRRPALPCRVIMTRHAPRSFDSDNLVHAFKHVRDQVAKWIGVDDRHDDRVEYVCRQLRTGPGQYRVHIAFEEKDPPHETTDDTAA